MRPDERTKLEERDEQLLLQFCDGECGLIERWKVRRMLGANPAAREFVDEMQGLRERTRELFAAAPAGVKVDIWERVERRIEQEERAEIFLGRRAVSVSTAARFQPAAGWKRELFWSLSGAAVAACVMLVVIDRRPASGPFSPTNLQAGDATQMVNSAVQPVSLGADIPRIFDDESDEVEVEWMRSTGRVRLIQDKRRKATVIWVKRSSPLSGLAAHEAKEPIRMIEPGVPTAIGVKD